MTGWTEDEHQKHLTVHQRSLRDFMRKELDGIRAVVDRAARLNEAKRVQGNVDLIRAAYPLRWVLGEGATPTVPKLTPYPMVTFDETASLPPLNRPSRYGLTTHHIWMDEEKPDSVFSAASASTQNVTESGLNAHSTRLVAAAVAVSPNSKPRLKQSGETLLDLWKMKTMLENPAPTPPPSPTSTDSPAGNP